MLRRRGTGQGGGSGGLVAASKLAPDEEEVEDDGSKEVKDDAPVAEVAETLPDIDRPDIDLGDYEVAGAVDPDAPEQFLQPIDKRIGEMLIEKSLVTEEQLEWGLEQQREHPGTRIGQILIAAGYLRDRQFAKTLAEQQGLPFADLRKGSPEVTAVASIPEAVARQLQIIPLKRVNDVLEVAVADPLIPELMSVLEAQSGGKVRIMVGAGEDISRIITRTYRAVEGVEAFVKVFEARAATRETEAVQEVDENAPIVQVVTMILSQAVRDRASDIHIEPMGDRVRVRNRIDGALHEVLSLPTAMSAALVSRIKIMANMNIVERRRPQDGQLEITVDGRGLDVRVSTTSTVFGEKTVLRVLDKQRALYDLEQLGMPEDTNALYKEVIRSPFGMVVCAGPTGSGKTTTLYATLATIDDEEINVMTIEDPVEYVFPTINQIPINEQAGVTFATGLRAILRQDPDAVLVGEIRDIETARIAVQAALTGHFVLSTIHATDAVSALHRFLDMGIESFLLSSSVIALVGQRLIRTICPECIEPYEPTVEDLAFFGKLGGDVERKFMHGAGCTFCADTGYFGRIGVYEVLKMTDEMRNLVVHDAALEDMRVQAEADGMVNLREQALRLVLDDRTTIAEVIRTVYIL